MKGPLHIIYTFCKSRRIMVHVQSSWFPLIDRNPQTCCDIFKCGGEAFVKATHRVYTGAAWCSWKWQPIGSSFLELPVLSQP